MGAMAQASCGCGYSGSIRLGGGMLNFETVCLFPIYCRTCQTLQTTNLFESPVKCNKCDGTDVTVYDDPELLGEPGTRKVFSWDTEKQLGRVLRLSDGRYLYPACGQMRLRFQRTASWD